MRLNVGNHRSSRCLADRAAGFPGTKGSTRRTQPSEIRRAAKTSMIEAMKAKKN